MMCRPFCCLGLPINIKEAVVAEYRIALAMEIVGVGEDQVAAEASAVAQYTEMVEAYNGIYDGEGSPLVGGVPTAAAVLFVRKKISEYISEVVMGWRRQVADESAKQAVNTEVIMLE